jgi:POT family proton-dependent oligopeptide transporter
MNQSIERDSTHGPQLFGQPRGLATLFMTEMWERFSYYGMRAILILFMAGAVADGGLGLDDKTANAVYGLYIAATYLLAPMGGWIADRLIGQQRSVVWGGVLIMLGNGSLAAGDTRPFFVPITATALGYSAGFALPAVCMVFGLVQFQLTKGHLGSSGLVPLGKPATWWPIIGFMAVLVVIAALGVAGTIAFNPVRISVVANWTMIALAAGYFGYLYFFAGLESDERKRVIAMIALFAACAMFWAGFEQTGASLNLFADRHTDRVIFGWDMPAGVLQGVNPAFIIIFAPVFAAVWVNLGKRNMDPSAPFKFALGLILMGIGFLVMFLAARYVVMGEKVLPTWLILTYLLHTFGELCLSPVGLSSMTKLAPARFVGQVMGLWFLATAIGNNLAGQFAGEIDPNNLPSMPGQFLYLFWWGAISGAVLLVLTPFVRKMMAGVK